MRKIINIALLALFGLAVLTSCSKEDDPMFSASTGSGTSYIQFDAATLNVSWPSVNEENVAEDYNDVILIKVLGPVSSSDRVMNFTVDPSSTAVAGTHYAFGDTKFTVKANTTYAELPYTLYNTGFADDEQVTLKMQLSDGDFELASIATDITVNLKKRKVCPWYDNIIFEGDYTVDVVEPTNASNSWECSAELNTTGDSLHIYIYWYSSEDRLTMAIDKANKQLHPEDYVRQYIYWGDAYDGYGRISFDEMSDANVGDDLCNLSFTFTAVPYLPDTGYWWGGEHTFTLTKIMTKSGNMTKKPLQPFPF